MTPSGSAPVSEGCHRTLMWVPRVGVRDYNRKLPAREDFSVSNHTCDPCSDHSTWGLGCLGLLECLLGLLPW